MYHGGYTIFGRHSNRALNSFLQRSGKRQDLFPFFYALLCYLSVILIAGYRAGYFFGRGAHPVIHTDIKVCFNCYGFLAFVLLRNEPAVSINSTELALIVGS